MNRESIWWWGAGILAGASIVVRIVSLRVATPDFIYFVAKWTAMLAAAPGLTAFSQPFADYAPLYLYMLKFLALVPAPVLYSSKLLSMLGDVGIAFVGALIVRTLDPAASRAKLFFCATVLFAAPTVILNSAVWGQSDALYGAFVLAAVWAMMRARPGFAALMLGVAVCFKLQAIFILPVFVGYALWQEKRWKYLLTIPVLFALSLVPALLGGGAFTYWGLIYIKESGEYSNLTLGAPSLLAFFPDAGGAFAQALSWAALGLCAAVALWFVWITYKSMPTEPRHLLLLCLACAVAMPYLLPRMHERYFYLADVLSVVWALGTPRQWYVPVLVVMGSLVGYMAYLKQSLPYLAPFAVDIRIGAAAMTAALLVLAIPVVKEIIYPPAPYPNPL